MTSILKADTIQDTDGNNIINESGNTITIGASGDTVAVPSGGKLTAPGHVLQVVQQVYSTFAQTNSQSYTDTGLTLNITPTSTSNKVLVIVSANLGTNTGSAQTISMDLLRAGSSIRVFETVLAASSAISGQISFSFLDSPSSTSALTYKVQYKGSAGTGQYIRINNYAGSTGDSASTITLMEVAG
jgi:hypothetical protein